MHNTEQDRKRLLAYFKKHNLDQWYSKYYGALLSVIFVQGYFAVICAGRKSEHSIPHGMYFQNFSRDREFYWLWNIEEMKQKRAELFQALETDTKFATRFFRDYLRGWKKFDKTARKAEKTDITKLSDQDLIKKLLNLIESGACQAHGYVADSLLSFSQDDWFVEYLIKYLGKNPTNEEVEILRQPTHNTFVNDVEILILKAAERRAKGKSISRLVNRLVSKYYWVENNYLRAEPKTKEQFVKEIDQAKGVSFQIAEARTKTNLLQKQALLNRIGASRLLSAFVQMADDFTFIQDCRKQAVLRLNFFIFTYLAELAKRKNFDSELINYIIPFELLQWAENPAKFETIAKIRKQGCLIVYGEQGYAVFNRQELGGINLGNFFKDYSEIDSVSGTPAQQGKVKGLARIVFGSDQFEEFQAGDILITNQTTPDFVPLMKKARAIITEQGGITSHAAIISRELGIPCIVGIKDAMKIFHDSDFIEVDAVQGKVKILTRK